MRKGIVHNKNKEWVIGKQSHGCLAPIKHPRLTVVVLDDASPFCTLGAEKAEEVDPPFWKK